MTGLCCACTTCSSLQEFLTESTRPTIERIDDGELELDRWGRPKKPQFTMPTEALPDDVDPENLGPLPSLLHKTALRVDVSAETAAAPAPGSVQAPRPDSEAGR